MFFSTLYIIAKKVETTQIFINQGTDLKMWYIHKISYYLELKRDEYWCMLWHGQNLENITLHEWSQILYDSIYIKFPGKARSEKLKVSGCQKLGGGVTGEYLLMEGFILK
jgi:hypothetical protein